MNDNFIYSRYDISLYTIGELAWRQLPVGFRPGGRDVNEFNELSLREQEDFLRRIKQSMTSTIFKDVKPIEKKSEPTNDKPKTANVAEETCSFDQSSAGFQKARSFIEISWSRTSVFGVHDELNAPEAIELRSKFISLRKLLDLLDDSTIDDQAIRDRTHTLLYQLLLDYVRKYNHAHGGYYVPVSYGSEERELRAMTLEGNVLKLTRVKL